VEFGHCHQTAMAPLLLAERTEVGLPVKKNSTRSLVPSCEITAEGRADAVDLKQINNKHTHIRLTAFFQDNLNKRAAER